MRQSCALLARDLEVQRTRRHHQDWKLEPPIVLYAHLARRQHKHSGLACAASNSSTAPLDHSGLCAWHMAGMLETSL